MRSPCNSTRRTTPNFEGRGGMFEDERYTKLAIPASIAFMAGFARFAFSDKKSLWSFFRGVVLAGFIGLMTSLGIVDLPVSEGVKGMIIGVTSFCADEVAMFIIAVANEVRKDPLGYVSKFIDALRGAGPKT